MSLKLQTEGVLRCVPRAHLYGFVAGKSPIVRLAEIEGERVDGLFCSLSSQPSFFLLLISRPFTVFFCTIGYFFVSIVSMNIFHSMLKHLLEGFQDLVDVSYLVSKLIGILKFAVCSSYRKKMYF